MRGRFTKDFDDQDDGDLPMDPATMSDNAELLAAESAYQRYLEDDGRLIPTHAEIQSAYLLADAYLSLLNQQRRQEEVDARTGFDVDKARRAYEVLMRRGWSPIRADDGWYTIDRETGCGVENNDVDDWPDPFTALIEADEWYKANVEGVPLKEAVQQRDALTAEDLIRIGSTPEAQASVNKKGRFC